MSAFGLDIMMVGTVATIISLFYIVSALFMNIRMLRRRRGSTPTFIETEGEDTSATASPQQPSVMTIHCPAVPQDPISHINRVTRDQKERSSLFFSRYVPPPDSDHSPNNHNDEFVWE